MTPEAQRIAIAEACPEQVEWHDGEPIWKGQRSPVEEGSEWIVFDPLNDLNAMHEAEKTLTFHQETDYIAHLMRQHKDYPMTRGFMATAAQRAEAFLRTLNLWRDDP